MTLPPWEYLFATFNDKLFPDLFNAIWIFSLVGIVAVLVLYNVRTRQLRRHQPYLDLYEWLLWTSVTLFFLLLVYAVFHFDFIFTVVTLPVGLAVLAWVRFVRFPPELARYQQQLAKARFYSKQKFAHPEFDDPAEAGAAPPRLSRWRSAASASDTGALAARPERPASPPR